MTRTAALRVVLCLLVVCTAPATVSAQDDSHWGVAVGWVPEWESHDIVKILFDDAERLELTGDEFRIGIGRGRTLGGDWSISYIRKKLDAGSRLVIEDPRLEDFGTGETFLVSEDVLVQDVNLQGIEWQRFVPFATIKRRVQIGMTFGVGIAQVEGTIVRRQSFAEFNETTFDLVQASSETQEPAQQMVIGESEYLPLGKIEISVGAIVAPGLKVRVSGGFNMPGVPAIGGTVVYLFGAD